MNSKILQVIIGALGGLSATGPMTIAMERWHRCLPANEQTPLPPREITDELETKAGLPPTSGPGKAALVLLNHFAYGAAAGALYGGMGHKVHSPLKGVIFGLGVWFISYLGVLPSASLLRPATEHTYRRNLLMLAAHVVWGFLLGLFVREIMRENSGALVASSSERTPERPAG